MFSSTPLTDPPQICFVSKFSSWLLMLITLGLKCLLSSVYTTFSLLKILPSPLPVQYHLHLNWSMQHYILPLGHLLCFLARTASGIVCTDTLIIKSGHCQCCFFHYRRSSFTWGSPTSDHWFNETIGVLASLVATWHVS